MWRERSRPRLPPAVRDAPWEPNSCRPLIRTKATLMPSADGINVALVRIKGRHELGSQGASRTAGGSRGRERSRHIELLGHAEHPYPKQGRAAVLAAMNASRASVADLARLNFLLG